ncbi:putative structural protein [Klebsiella phage vB_KaeD_HazelMika]|nr:putative structural protein [Klebsiella phage vB_KaeD_HazelMika]
MVLDDYDVEVSARKALASFVGERYPIAFPNYDFTEPDDGSMWLKFDYVPVDKVYRSLDRKCISLISMIQIGVIFQPGSGTDDARKLAKELVNFFEDGKILNVGFILSGAETKPTLKHNAGWLIPIRFTVRYDEHPERENKGV